MTPSLPHSSTMGTGDRNRISVAVFRLCGHAASGPRLVFDQSNCLISPPSSPPPVGNDPPDLADTPLFGNGSPFEKWAGINGEKSLIAAFVPPRATLSQGSPGVNPVLGRSDEMARRQPPTIDRKMDGRGGDTVVSSPGARNNGQWRKHRE